MGASNGKSLMPWPESLPATQIRDLLAQGGKASRGRGLRLSPAQARALGLPVQKTAGRRARKNPLDPQAILTSALREKLGEAAVLSEVRGLIPGRRFRADIVIPAARLVIEFDGFQYHRSKAAFQKDRERQNLFVVHGWRVLRFFNKQIRDDLGGVVESIVGLTGRAQRPPLAPCRPHEILSSSESRQERPCTPPKPNSPSLTRSSRR